MTFTPDEAVKVIQRIKKQDLSQAAAEVSKAGGA